MRLRAVGFDLGETLCEYSGVPLSWIGEYPAALARVAEACACELSAARLRSGTDVLMRYNARVTPRPQHREYTAERIFAELLEAWGVPPERLSDAIAAFFQHFSSRVRAFPESGGVLAHLRELGVATGLLTDVPYGMPTALVVSDLSAAGLHFPRARLLTSTIVGHRKPHAAGFEALAGRLEVPRAELLYVGNEQKDIEGAAAAGCQTALIWRATSDPPAWGQHVSLRSLDALRELSYG